MMIDFKEPSLNDKTWADELLRRSDFAGCEYSFGSNFMWAKAFDIKIARYKDFYLVKNKFGFTFPAGEGDVYGITEVLREEAAKEDKQLCYTSMNKACAEKLQELYGDDIKIQTNRDFYDYVYNFDDLSTLGGRKYHAKRNHISRFRENNYAFEPITPENVAECSEMNKRWCAENNPDNDKDKLLEAEAVYRGLDNFFALGMVGGLLRVDGEVNAFTFGERLNSDTFVVHVEKAFTRLQGTYPAINYEFVNYACKGYTYINREEDMGAENLRKAKLSYYPAFLVEKHRVYFNQ